MRTPPSPHNVADVLTPERIDAAFSRLNATGAVPFYRLIQEQAATKRDKRFRKTFNMFYRVSRRKADWYDHFYTLFDEASAAETVPSFRELLATLHQRTGMYEASFTSKLLATLDPHQPVIDSVVLRNLGLKLPAYYRSDRLADMDALHGTLCRIYADYLETAAGKTVVARFQEVFGADITPVKIVDFVLWQIR